MYIHVKNESFAICTCVNFYQRYMMVEVFKKCLVINLL